MALPDAERHSRLALLLGLAAVALLAVGFISLAIGLSAPPALHCAPCSPGPGPCPLYCYTTVSDSAVVEIELGEWLLASSVLVGAAASVVRWLDFAPLF